MDGRQELHGVVRAAPDQLALEVADPDLGIAMGRSRLAIDAVRRCCERPDRRACGASPERARWKRFTARDGSSARTSERSLPVGAVLRMRPFLMAVISTGKLAPPYGR